MAEASAWHCSAPLASQAANLGAGVRIAGHTYREASAPASIKVYLATTPLGVARRRGDRQRALVLLPLLGCLRLRAWRLPVLKPACQLVWPAGATYRIPFSSFDSTRRRSSDPLIPMALDTRNNSASEGWRSPRSSLP